MLRMEVFVSNITVIPGSHENRWVLIKKGFKQEGKSGEFPLQKFSGVQKVIPVLTHKQCDFGEG